MQVVFRTIVFALFAVVAPVAVVADETPDESDTDAATSATEESTEPDLLIFTEEVTVVAQKREQEIQEVPISTTILTRDMLLDFDIFTTVMMEQKVPNLRINFDRLGGANAAFEIRGVGHLTDGDEISSQPVTVHFNQVPSPFNITTGGLIFDMEHVEVLRGPQGDLFGLNTTGGTINYLTARPTSTLQAGVYLEAGNYRSGKLEAFVSGPLTGKWSGRVAIASRQLTDGWQTNAETGERYGEIDLGGARVSARYAGSAVLADIEAHVGWNNSDPPLGRLVAPFTTVLGEQIEPVGGWNDVGWSDTSGYSTTEGRPFTDSGDVGMTANVMWNLGQMTLSSVTGYQDFDRTGWFDADGSVAKEADLVRRTDVRSLSQEVRIASNGSDPVSWMAGVYAATDSVENGFALDSVESTVFPAVPGNDTSQDRDAGAVFGRIEWLFSTRWQLDLGLRYSRERRSIFINGTQLRADPLGFLAGIYQSGDILTDSITTCLTLGECTPGVPYSDEIDHDDWSGKVNLLFALSDPWRLYLSVSRGFKSGGFNDNSASSSLQFLPVRPERLYAYELGAKARLAGGALRWNNALFYYDFRDQQVEDFVVDPLFGPLRANTNVPDSELYGFETELLWQIGSRLALTQGLGCTKGSFASFAGIDAAAVAAQAQDPDFEFYTPVYVDRSGEAIGFPNWQYNGMFEYLIPIAQSRRVRLAVDYSYESEAERPGAIDRTLPAFWLLNARVSYRFNGGLEVGLWGRNLTNTEYLNFWDNSLNAEVQIVGMPRTFGTSLRWRY